MIAERTFDEALLYVCPDIAQRIAQRKAKYGNCAIALLGGATKNILRRLLPDLRQRTISDPPVNELNIRICNGYIWASRKSSHRIFQNAYNDVQIKWDGSWHIHQEIHNMHLIHGNWYSICNVVAILPCGAVLQYVNNRPAMYNPTNDRKCWLTTRPRTYTAWSSSPYNRTMGVDILINDYGEPCVVENAAFSSFSKCWAIMRHEP